MRLHGTEATHVETVPIKEEFQGQIIWEGEVEVFDLHDHPKTHRVYAWAHETEDADHPRRHPCYIFRQPQAHGRPYRRQL
jgi:hypothetical protein